MLLGRDPQSFLNTDSDGYLINLATLKKAQELDQERLDYLADRFAHETANIIVKAFGS